MPGLIGPCGAYRTIQDEGTALTRRSIIDFVGSSVTATDDAANERTLVTISGGGGVVVIADSTLAASAASFDITSIPGTYACLLLTAYLRSTAATGLVGTRVRYNGDTSAVYDWQLHAGTGAAASASNAISNTSAPYGDVPGSTATANDFGVVVAHIPNYANASGFKPADATSGLHVASVLGSMDVVHTASFWRATAAINQITVFPSSGSWDTGSRLTLYGL